MFCPNCGKLLEEGTRFCTACGQKIEVNAGAPAPEPVQPVYGQEIEPPRIVPVDNTGTPGAVVPDPPYPGQGDGVQQGGPLPVDAQLPAEKPGFYVKRMPLVVIAVMTIVVFLIGAFLGDAAATPLFALLAGGIPALVLIFLIYRLDTIEPEPKGLLLKLFLLGAVSCLPACFLETALGPIVSAFFGEGSIIFMIIENFIVVALSEELCKYVILKHFTWKHPAFNYRFDGVVYSTTVALGFEALEDILYITSYGMGNAFVRAAFPGHCVFGIYLGYWYGQAKAKEIAGDVAGAKAMRRRGLLTAVVMHGCYDFICSFQNGFMTILYFVVIIALNITAYRNIKKYAYEDQEV